MERRAEGEGRRAESEEKRKKCLKCLKCLKCFKYFKFWIIILNELEINKINDEKSHK